MQFGIGRITAAIYRTNQVILNERLKELDISGGQIDYLYVIARSEGLSQVELADILFVNKSAVTKVVNAFVKKGYVRRETDSIDHRVSRLYLTDKGHNIKKSVEEAFQDLIFLHNKYLTEEENTQTIQALEKVLSGLLQEKEKIKE